MRLMWRALSLKDREHIMQRIAGDNPMAAIHLDALFETYAESARQQPQLYKAGRITGTREIVVKPNYVMVYRVQGEQVEVVRILHSRQQWPSA